MKKIYIVHTYGEESHYLALYKCAKKYGFSPSHQIVLRNTKIFRRFAVNVKRGKPIFGFFNFILDIISKIRFLTLKNQLLIVGIAPYDYLMNKYDNIFKKNRCYYFTSHTNWDNGFCLPGTIENKDFFEKTLTEHFLGIFCVSTQTYNQVKRFGLPSVVVNHSIEYDEYKKNKFNDSALKKFVFVGTYNERKNVRLIIDWIKANDNSSFDYTFIGDGPLRDEINDLCKMYKNIHNRGFLSKNELKATLCKYDFLVLPSKEEPFGIVLAEALSSGVPCIVSSAFGPREIITDGYNGFVFDLENQESSFSYVMQKCLNIEEETMKQMIENAILSGKKYSPEEIVKKWMILLKMENQYEE